MIHFERSGNSVKISVRYISGDGDIDTFISTAFPCSSDVAAEALAKDLDATFRASVEREIKTAYEAGYRAGRSKKIKRSWFHSYITHIGKSLSDWKLR